MKIRKKTDLLLLLLVWLYTALIVYLLGDGFHPGCDLRLNPALNCFLRHYISGSLSSIVNMCLMTGQHSGLTSAAAAHNS